MKCIRKLLPEASSVRIALILSCSQRCGEEEEEERGGERHDDGLQARLWSTVVGCDWCAVSLCSHDQPAKDNKLVSGISMPLSNVKC